MIRFLIGISLTLCLGLSAQSQRNQLLSFDYIRADSHALNYPKGRYDDARIFAKELCEGFDTEHEKFRIIYRWIAENVEYKTGRKGTDANVILKKKKAICEGFASLLEAMCASVDIRCETVVGFAKSDPGTDIPMNMKETNHAWNAVFLAGEWHLVDVTWSSGYYDPTRRKHIQSFNPVWFIADPDFFIFTHFPENERWQLNKKPMKKRVFKRSPILKPEGYDIGMKLMGKQKGRMHRTFKLAFKTESEVSWASIRFEREDESQGLLLVKKSDHYELKYRFDKTESGGFYLFLDGKAVYGFVK
jgi:hypothetical protein